jgi:ABC-2 type transport system permease protein
VTVRVTLATAGRVLRQLRRDHRTLALVFVVPPLLMTLFRYVFDGQPETFDRVGGPLVGIFPFSLMFVITSVTMLRERATGTLERLMTLPLAKGDLLAGYALAFALVAAVQALVTSAVAFGLLGLDVRGSVVWVVALAVANALLGMALGLFASAFAQTEFQAVQFMPAFVLPQVLLCGLLVPRERMATLLEWISLALPLTWAYEGLREADRAQRGDRPRRYRCRSRLGGGHAAPEDAVTVQVAVIGSGREHEERAEAVGRLLAERGATLVCGGRGEVMAAAARGAKSVGGTTIGILPGESRAHANEWIDHAVATGVGHARNLAVVASGDAVIAVGGRWGTLAEIGLAKVLQRYVVILEPGWDIEGLPRAATPREAVELALANAR